MALYAIAWLSFFDNDLHIGFAYADAPLEAMGKVIPDFTFAGPKNTPLTDIYKDMFDMDMAVKVTEVPFGV